MRLTKLQFDILSRLRGAQPVDLAQLVADLGVDQSQVAGACAELKAAALLSLDETQDDELTLGEPGAAFVEKPLPERVIIATLAANGGELPLTEIPNHCDLTTGDVGQSLRWLTHRGWATKQGASLKLGDIGPDPAEQPDEALIKALAARGPTRASALRADGLDVAAGLDILSKRKGFVTVRQRTDRTAAITTKGETVLAGADAPKPEVNQLTPEMMADGGWREVEFRPYDVTLAAGAVYPGKEHGFQRTLDKVRRVFLELGFTEVVSPWVESSFWDFDALFQPQDHPARDMQDTFYIAKPDRARLPDEGLVRRVQAAHEDGGDTSSTGWRYRWNGELAHKPVLRTHTTAATIRALAANADKPTGKYFVIGPVFRRETVDYKHLPMFHQVDGIIVDPKASLSSLLGMLTAFYGKMGFPKIRFRPSFFPYTEPSAEVYLYVESRREWMEMGGSGIFRPEVTRPLGVQNRVLAWGLGLERLGMMIHGLKSIGELYFASMPWLREAPLIRG
ncbi:MAG: phenylalanine--tRNA ligase subunit alpha [Phycisphaerales bacterium]|nr:phenylalanine--tRNA ligase subunit alpha [Phycisphaerales bacterium]